MSEQKLSPEKSQELANSLIMIASIIQTIDQDYLNLAAKYFEDQANWQVAASVLNPSHLPIKNELLAAEAHALNLLSKYIDKLKEIDSLKERVKVQTSQMNDIHNLFM